MTDKLTRSEQIPSWCATALLTVIYIGFFGAWGAVGTWLIVGLDGWPLRLTLVAAVVFFAIAPLAAVEHRLAGEPLVLPTRMESIRKPIRSVVELSHFGVGPIELHPTPSATETPAGSEFGVS